MKIYPTLHIAARHSENGQSGAASTRRWSTDRWERATSTHTLVVAQMVWYIPGRCAVQRSGPGQQGSRRETTEQSLRGRESVTDQVPVPVQG